MKQPRLDVRAKIFREGVGLNRDGNFFNGAVRRRVVGLHFIRAFDFIRADFRTDDFFFLRLRTGTFSAKNF